MIVHFPKYLIRKEHTLTQTTGQINWAENSCPVHLRKWNMPQFNSDFPFVTQAERTSDAG